MAVVTTTAGQDVIVEGEQGDTLYIIEEGEFDCFKVINGSSTYLKTYKPGDFFGELALITNKPRAATIRCLQDCHFAVIQKEDYQKVLQKIEQKNLIKKIEFLHSLPFFKVWTRTSLNKIQYSLEQKNYIRN